MNLMTSFFLAFVAGLFMPLLAFNMTVNAVTADWPKDEPHCLTGFVGIIVLGYLIDIVGCFIIVIVGRTMYIELPKQDQSSCTVQTTERVISLKKVTYSSDNGELTIEQEYQHPNIGENVYINNQIVESGKYKIGLLNYIKVLDGKIIKITLF
jgi:hypothetical protein